MRTLRISIAGTIILALVAGSAGVVSAQSDDTHADRVGGALVYGDPAGRFTLPFAGDWTAVETDGSYGHFQLAEPAIDAYVVTVESDDLDVVAEAALAQIGHDRSLLSPLATFTQGRWTFDAYALDPERGVTMAARQVDDATVAFLVEGGLGVTTAPPAEAFLTIDGLALMSLDDYREFQPPPAPTSTDAIDDLDRIAFYSDGQKLVGRLVLPEGEGPFPAVVMVHGAGPVTRHDGEFDAPALQAAGIATFSYDKRGAGDSEGLFVGTEDMTGSPLPSEWRLPQLADDAVVAAAFLQGLEEIDADRIGLFGYSQAGWVIPQVAAGSDIPAYAVTIIGPAVSVGEVNYHQELTGKPRVMEPLPESERDDMSERLAAFDGTPGFDPRGSIEQMSIPGLWILGDRDGWIPARETRLFLESMVSEHDKDFTIVYDPEGGHQGKLSYLDEAADWILAHLDE